MLTARQAILIAFALMPACGPPVPVPNRPPPAWSLPAPIVSAAPEPLGAAIDAGVAAPAPSPLEVALEFSLPPAKEIGEPLLLWATNYYLPEVASLAEGGHPLRDLDGRNLGPRLTTRDWCNAALQGSVRVTGDDDIAGVYNYAGTTKKREVDCLKVFRAFRAIGYTRFDRAVGSYGDGLEGISLVPYRTVAVDPNTIPFGSVVYIPDARGESIVLPTGEERVHDGYFYAGDRGGAIKKQHIDVFAGVDKDEALKIVGNKRDKTFEAFIVYAPETIALLDAAHRWGRPEPEDADGGAGDAGLATAGLDAGPPEER